MLNLLLLLVIGIIVYRVYKAVYLVENGKSWPQHPNTSANSKKQKATDGKEAVDAEFQVIND